MEYKRTDLENGLKIISFYMPGMESISLGIWLNAGGRYEKKKLCGISHFLEHLVFRGTKKRTARQIKEAVEGLGGMLNAFTAEEFTCYLVKIRSKHLRLALDVLMDMVLNAKLSADDVEKERAVILEEIRMYLDLPMHYVHELLSTLLWPDQPLGMLLSGTFETVSQIKAEQIRHYRDEFYLPCGTTIVACGSLKHEELVSNARKYFATIPSGKKQKFAKVKISQTKPQTNFLDRNTEQTHISLGVHALSRDHPDKYALTLLHIILGANMSSRLFQEVREKRGLAYEIGTQLKRYMDTGALLVSAGMEHKNACESINVILKELRKIKKEPLGKKEFNRAKEYFIGQFLLALEDTMDHMIWLGEHLATLDKFYTKEEVLKKINKVSREDILRLAQQIFKTEDLNLALIGPMKEKDKKKIEEALIL